MACWDWIISILTIQWLGVRWTVAEMAEMDWNGCDILTGHLDGGKWRERTFFWGKFGSTFLFGGFYFFVGIFHANGMIRYPCRWVKAAVLLATCSLDFSWFWRFGQLQKMGMELHWHRHQIGVIIVIIYRTDLHSSMRSQKSIRRSHKIYFGCASQLASGFYMVLNPYITGIIVPYVYIRGVP